MSLAVKLYFCLLVVIFVLFTTHTSNAQVSKDTITAKVAKEKIIIENGFWGDNYYISGQEYSRKQINNILETDKFLRSELKSVRRIQSLGNLTMTAGLVFTGISVYLAIKSEYSGYSPLSDVKSPYGDEGETNPFVITALLALGLDITGIVLISTANSSFEKVILTYNQNLLSSNSGFDFRFNITSVCLTYNF